MRQSRTDAGEALQSVPVLVLGVGITALGAGGTNCHVILEEAPEVPPSSPSRPWQLLLLSAKTPTALDTATQNLAAHLK